MATTDLIFPETLSKFLKSQKRQRWCRGPIGPVSADTEFFTGTGWKRIDEYAPGDCVGDVDMSDPYAPVLSIRRPVDYIVTPADTLLHVSNAHSLSMVVSENHRVPFYDYKGRFKTLPAYEVVYNISKQTLPLFFTPDAAGLPYSDDMLRFAVMMHADGYFPMLCGKTGHPASVSLRKEHKKRRFKALMRRLGIPFREYTNATRPTEVRYSFYPPYVGKHYSEFWGASVHQLEVIIEEMSHWDGLYSHKETRFHTTCEEDADFMQYAAHAVGRRATVRRKECKQEAWRDCYIVHIATEGSPKNKAGLSTAKVVPVPTSDGKQYCFSTRGTYFLARHNGRVFITGNSGKSLACATDIFLKAAAQKPGTDGIRYTRFAVVRNTLQQLKTTVLPTIQTIFRPISHWKVSDSTLQVRVDDIHCDIILLPLDTEANIQRLLSLELTGGWVSEFREIRPELITTLMSRCGRYPSVLDGGPSWYGTIAETNSFSEDSPYFDLLEAPFLSGNLPTTWDYFVQPSGLAPNAENIQNLPPDYYKDMIESNTKEWCDQYVRNMITPSLSGQAVFKNSFDGDWHVSEGELIPSRGYPLIIGMDTGRNPAATICQVNHSGQLLVLDQVWQANMGMRRFLREVVMPKLNEDRFVGLPSFVCVDPAGLQRSQIGEQSVLAAIKAEGFDAQVAQTNIIDPRLRAVDNWLLKSMPGGKPAMVFDVVHCGPTIQDMRSGYRFKIKKDGDTEDRPSKSHPESDRADSLQYACLGTAKNILGRVMGRRGAGQPKEPPVGGWT